MTLALACLSIAFERRLLLLVLRVYEFAIETVHDRQFTELRPEEVDLFRLFFLMEEPPEAVLKQGSHHHLIVAFAYVAPVVERLRLGLLVDLQVAPEALHVLHGMLTDLLLKEGEGLVGSRLKLVFLLHDLAHVEDEFFFDGVCIFTHFERGRHQLVLRELHSQPLAELDGVGDVLHGASLRHPRPEHESGELVVVGEHFIDSMVHMVIVLVHILNYSDFRWRVPDIKWIHLVLRRGAGACCSSSIDVVCNFALDAHGVRDLTQAACRHLARLPRRILLFGRVASGLEVRESRAGRRGVERSCLILTFIASSTYLLSLGLGRCHLRSGLAVVSHVRRGTFVGLILLAAGRVDRKIAFGSLGFLDGRVHLQLRVVGNDHDDALGQVLSALALHQDVIDVLLLDGDLEALVHFLEVAAELHHELAHVVIVVQPLLRRRNPLAGSIVDILELERGHDKR